jgi:hypothetical protein
MIRGEGWEYTLGIMHGCVHDLAYIYIYIYKACAITLYSNGSMI